MSETMLLGVLRMPIELWTDDIQDKCQRESRYYEAANKIETLEKQNTQYKETIERLENSWVSVEDRLPEKRGRYLVQLNGSNIVIVHFYSNKWVEKEYRDYITHWMPLPPKPTVTF